jgi:hypothetical protein
MRFPYYFCLILTLFLEMDLIPAFATFFACIFYEQLEVGIVIGRREILTLLIFLNHTLYFFVVF